MIPSTVTFSKIKDFELEFELLLDIELLIEVEILLEVQLMFDQVVS